MTEAIPQKLQDFILNYIRDADVLLNAPAHYGFRLWKQPRFMVDIYLDIRSEKPTHIHVKTLNKLTDKEDIIETYFMLDGELQEFQGILATEIDNYFARQTTQAELQRKKLLEDFLSTL